jgi:hypothetical protein
VAIDNMYRRRRLGPPLGVRINALFTGIGWLFERSEPKP